MLTDNIVKDSYAWWSWLALVIGVLAVLSGESYGVIIFLTGVLLWGIRDWFFPTSR